MDIHDVKGPYDVLFVGRTDYARVVIDTVWRSGYGDILYITDTSGAIYNWSNILVMRKARGEK